jgi:hypothetical protein
MLRRVALVTTDVSQEHSTSIIRVTRISDLGTTLAVTSNRNTLRRNHLLRLSISSHSALVVVTANVVTRSLILVTLMMEALRSCDTSVLIRAIRRNIPEDGILHSHRRENLKSCIALTGWSVYRRSNVSPVKHELGFYIPEDDILLLI